MGNDSKKDDKSNNPFDFKKQFNPGGGENPQMKIMRNVLVWIILFGGIVMVYMFMQGPQRAEWPVTYTQYKNLLANDKIKKAVITKSQLNDYEFHGELKNFETINIEGKPRNVKYFVTKLGIVDTETEKLWAEKGIDFTYEESSDAWWGAILSILPWILLIAFYVFFLRRMQGGAGGSKGGIFSFGKSRAKLLSDNQKKVTFEDVAGCDEAKEELEEIIDFLKEPEKFQKLGGRIPRGVLLLGPPGTGKTLLARAVAGEANVPFYSISGADFVEMFVGVGASRVRDLFETAKKNSPCIVFIDEIDAVGRHRGAGLGGGHDEREQTLNQLLVEMDGFEENNSTIIIAATNRPDVLDPALLRPGRFDRQIVVDRPDIKGRIGIFKVHTKKLPIGDDVDLEVLAKGTPGFSGADIANICNEAALHAARRNSNIITMYDFEQAKDKVMMGVERKSMVIPEKEKEITAYHEMGHALVGKFTPIADPVHKVTIIPRGRALGLTSYLPKEDQHSLSKEYLEAQLSMLMGGRAAEKIVFNHLSTGAANDLERATKLARKMVCDWGMSEKLGPVTFANRHEEVFLGKEMSQPRDHSELTAQEIDAEVRVILLKAYDVAEKILKEHIDLLHNASKILLERETIEGEELEMIVKGEELPPINLKKLNALRSMNIGNKSDGNGSDTENVEETESENLKDDDKS